MTINMSPSKFIFFALVAITIWTSECNSYKKIKLKQKCLSKFSTECNIRKKREFRHLENENEYLNQRQSILEERILIQLIARKKAAQLQRERELEAKERERLRLEEEKEARERERMRLENEAKARELLRLEHEAKERESLRLENEAKERERLRLEKEARERERLRLENETKELERLRSEKEARERERMRLENEAKARERIRLEHEAKERERLRLEKEKEARERERLRLENEAKEREWISLEKEKETIEREHIRLEEEKRKSDEKELKESEEKLRLEKEEEAKERERLRLDKEKEANEREGLKLEEVKRARETTTAYPIPIITTTTEKNKENSGLAVLIPLFGLVGGAFFFLKGTLPVLLFVVLPAITGLLVLPTPPPPPPPGPSGVNNNNNDSEDDQDDDKSEEKSSEESKEKKKKRFSCKIDIRKISVSYPLIIMPSEPTRFMFPTQGSAIILQPGEKVAFGCYRAETYECKNKTIISQIISTKEYSIDAMRCPLTLSPKVRPSPAKSYGYKKQYKKYQIGISYGSNFIPTIDIYFSIRTFSTSFVRILLPKSLKNHQKIPSSRSLRKDICCNDDARPVNMYERMKQRETFNNLFNCHGSTASNESCSYINDKNNANMYLVPSQLASESDFVYSRAAMTSFYYLNTAPQWKTIKYGNWENIEHHVRKMAMDMKKDLVVLTGVHEQLELLDQEDGQFKWKGVFMWHDPQNCKKEIPVPLYFWKLVYDPSNNHGIVFVTVNNPYLKNGKNYHLCKGAGQIIDGQVPAGWKPLDVKRGYSYMCQIEDFILTTEIDLVDKLYV